MVWCLSTKMPLLRSYRINHYFYLRYSALGIQHSVFLPSIGRHKFLFIFLCDPMWLCFLCGGKNLQPFWRTLIFPIDGFSAKTRQISGFVPFYNDAAPTELSHKSLFLPSVFNIRYSVFLPSIGRNKFSFIFLCDPMWLCFLCGEENSSFLSVWGKKTYNRFRESSFSRLTAFRPKPGK